MSMIKKIHFFDPFIHKEHYGERKMKYMEPYAKDKSLLQLSLFYFGKGRPQKTYVQWEDEEGKCSLECNCKYGVPGSFDQDVYTACMRLWVKQGMKDGGIHLNYSDIARELHLEPPRAWVGRIKKSLKKLGMARYEFEQCFVCAGDEDPQKKTVAFSLFDTTCLFEYKEGKSKRNSESKLIFPEEIQTNLEAKYYQFLDMVWYRALPEGLPRRLYEYLAKRRHHSINGEFSIGEEAICRWLPIKDKHASNRRKRLEKIANDLIAAGYLEAYNFDTKKKKCTYRYAKTRQIQVEQGENKAGREEPNQDEEGEKITAEAKTEYLDAMKWIDTIPYFHKARKEEIAALSFNQVAEYYPKIRKKYEAMAKSGKKPGPGWIYNAFKNKYKFAEDIKAEEKAEEYQREMQEYWQKQAERNAEREKLAKKLAEQQRFREAVDEKMAEDVTVFWDQAEKLVEKDQVGRETILKIEFCKLLLKFINTEREDEIDSDIFSPSFAIEMAKRIGI